MRWILCVAVLAGCGESPDILDGGTADGSSDVGSSDAAADAIDGTDAPLDAPPDAPSDAPPDAPSDVRHPTLRRMLSRTDNSGWQFCDETTCQGFACAASACS